ncbi:MAG: hypothetical protein M3281_06090 [Chloroflexota bacterium]|nr:hypothetical protein [Chloroflexota bacterium]
MAWRPVELASLALGAPVLGRELARGQPLSPWSVLGPDTSHERRTPAPAAVVPTGQQPERPCADCPQLSSVLRQLLAAPDAAAFATTRGLYYEDGRVRVTIRLAGAEDDLAERYALQAEARYRDQLQALAPLATLCDLSNDARVLAVRVPTQAAPT